MDVRKLSYEDYDNILVGWWKDWGWDSPTRAFLPDNGEGGLIVYDGDIPVCAGFVYVTNAKVAWIDWIISNKNYREKPMRNHCLNKLIESLSNVVEAIDVKYAYALIKHKSLIEVYKNNGFHQGDSYTSEMIKTF